MTYSRYAIYYIPDPGPLTDFAARWLGWDIVTGTACAAPDLPGLPRPAHDLTSTPHKYGFHATIKPPFRLAPGQTEDALRDAARDLIRTLPPSSLGRLDMSTIGKFIALTQIDDPAPVRDLAATIVRGLDTFRAPPTEAELTRRRAARLSPRQDALLIQWGYPYVMEEFRFHMTLSGRLKPDEIPQVSQALRIAMAPLLTADIPLTSLVVAGERADGRFEQIERMPIS